MFYLAARARQHLINVEIPMTRIAKTPSEACDAPNSEREFGGLVIKGYGYPHKMPTANIDHKGKLPQGVFIGVAFDVFKDIDSHYEEELGRCMVWSYPNSTIAEVFIAGFSGELVGHSLTIYDLLQLSREDLTHAATAAITALPIHSPSL